MPNLAARFNGYELRNPVFRDSEAAPPEFRIAAKDGFPLAREQQAGFRGVAGRKLRPTPRPLFLRPFQRPFLRR